MNVVEITWSHRASNPLDFLDDDIDFDLATSDGLPVKITKPEIEFRVYIDGKVELITGNNAIVCYLLNTRQVGWVDE